MAHRTTPRQGLQPQDDPNRLSRYPSSTKVTPLPLSSSSNVNYNHARTTYTDAMRGQDVGYYQGNTSTSSTTGVERSLAYLLQDMARRTPAERDASMQSEKQPPTVEPLTINKQRDDHINSISYNTSSSNHHNDSRNVEGSAMHSTLQAFPSEKAAQATLQNEFTASQQEEMNKVMQTAKEQVRRAQADCAATILRLQQEMTALQRALAAKEMALIEEERLRNDLVARELASRVNVVREELMTQWHAAAAAEATAQQNALRAATAEYAAATEALRTHYASREAENVKAHKEQLAQLERAVEERYVDQLAEANRTTAQQRELIETLRQSNAQLRAELVAHSEDHTERELAVQAAVLHARQVLDAQWQDKFSAMQKHYARLLQRALRPRNHLRRKAISDRDKEEDNRVMSAHRREDRREDDDDSSESDDDAHAMVPYATHSQALILLHSLEEQCVELKANSETKVRNAVAEVEALWQRRLEYEKERQAQMHYPEWGCQFSETEWSMQMQTMREALFAELQRQEVAQQERLQQAREQLMQEVVERYAAAAAADATQRTRELQAQCAELRAAHTTQAELRAQLVQEIRGEYALQLAEMHASYTAQASAMQEMWLDWQSTREQHWLRSREDEVRLLAEAHTRERAALLSHHHWLLQQIELHVKGRVDGDVEAFAARERALLEQLTALQVAQAERTTQQAEQLLAAQRVILQEAQAAEEERLQSRWKAMQDNLVRETWRMSEQRSSAYETELQERFAAELNAERTHFAQAMEQLKAEHAAALEKARAEASANASTQHNSNNNDVDEAMKRRVEELTTQYEAQLASQAQRHMQQLREADSALQTERARLQASSEALLRDQQETFDLQLRELRGECARRVEEAVAEKEKECRSAAEQSVRAAYETQLQELRTALEARTREVERLSAELQNLQASARHTKMVMVPATNNNDYEYEDIDNSEEDEDMIERQQQQPQQRNAAAVVISPPSSSSLSSIRMPPLQRVPSPTNATQLPRSTQASTTTSDVDSSESDVAMRKMWMAVEQLWHVLEVPQEERHAIRAEINALNDATARRASLKSELYERQEQLPLLELATRRDYLVHTLRELQARHTAEAAKKENVMRDNNNIQVGGSDREQGKTLSRAPSFFAKEQSLQEEIDRVVRQLNEEVAAYEEAHPSHRPLLYQGQPLLPSTH